MSSLFVVPKSIFASRTAWLNGVMTVIAALTAVGGQEWVASNPTATAIIVAAIGGLNVVLRFLTSQPVTLV